MGSNNLPAVFCLLYSLSSSCIPFNLFLTLESDFLFSLSFILFFCFPFCSAEFSVSFSWICIFVILWAELEYCRVSLGFFCLWFSWYPVCFLLLCLWHCSESHTEQLQASFECQWFSNSSLFSSTLYLILWNAIASASSTGVASFWDIRLSFTSIQNHNTYFKDVTLILFVSFLFSLSWFLFLFSNDLVLCLYDFCCCWSLIWLTGLKITMYARLVRNS